MSLSKLGDSEGQGSLACLGPWDCKELDFSQDFSSLIRLCYSQTELQEGPTVCGGTHRVHFRQVVWEQPSYLQIQLVAPLSNFFLGRQSFV